MRPLGASAASPERKRATLGARSPRDLIVLGIGGHLVGFLCVCARMCVHASVRENGLKPA